MTRWDDCGTRISGSGGQDAVSNQVRPDGWECGGHHGLRCDLNKAHASSSGWRAASGRDNPEALRQDCQGAHTESLSITQVCSFASES